MSASDHLSGEQFRVVHEHGKDENDGRVSAYSGRGEKQEWLGTLHYHVNHGYFDRTATYPDDIRVAPQHQRKGVASRLYGEAVAKTGQPMVHDPEAMTPEAVKAVDRDAAKNPGRHLRWNGRTTTPWEAS